MMKSILSIALSVLSVTLVTATELNLHVRAAPNALPTFQSIDKHLHGILGNNDAISFQTIHVPHNTLYLTDFPDLNIPVIVERLEKLAPTLTPCTMSMPSKPYTSNDWAFWDITKDECLQQLSDAVVLGISDLRNPNQTVPSWVRNLPEPERTIKTKLFNEYGSPNVFDEFSPHFTIGYSKDVSQLKTAVDSLQVPTPYQTPSYQLVLSLAGDHGSVLQKAEYFIYEF
eukprot:TRINITY_DN2062_c0_g1::TRINITY_DN2062_c0_g1_i1::g.21837::m.21837 TRINITY_DN2062_c0_g1::TRINITY_DN2062_c0_g1_i1::g.21837  ORF type:complete len:241 (-),score=25.24,DUF1045/PF06299.7/3.9e-06,2_5_RNA_ligase2/PF13563.1/6.8e-06 TRINITY_DN2062_c0_g1_i1:71-754(-)